MFTAGRRKKVSTESQRSQKRTESSLCLTVISNVFKHVQSSELTDDYTAVTVY